MARPRVLVITNIPAPYRVALFEAVYRDFAHFCVAFQAARERGRSWAMRPSLPFPVEYLPGVDVGVAGRHFRLNRGIADLVRRHDPDVVVAGGFSPTVARIADVCRREGRGLVLMNDGTINTDPVRGPEAGYRKSLISRADGFIGASQGSADYFTLMSAPAEAVTVVQLTTDLAAIQTATQAAGARSEARRRLGVDGRVVCFVGQLVERKRPLDALAAIEAASREVRDLSLLIAGDGPLRERVRSEIARRGLQRVRMLGLVTWEDVLSVYAASDLQIFPVVREPYGMVVIEGLAAGVPVISTTESGAAKDLVVDGQNGFLVQPGDTAEAAGRIVAFFREDGLAARMAREAREVVGKHDVRHEAVKFIAAVERFAATHSGTRVLPVPHLPQSAQRRVVYITRNLAPYRPSVLTALAASGVETHVVVAGRRWDSRDTDIAAPVPDGFAVHLPTARGFGWRADVLEICRRLEPATFLIEHGARLDFAWTVLLTRSLRSSTRILWSHGIENRELYSGRRSPGSFGRQWQLSLADGLLCYDQGMARRFERLCPGKLVGAAPNSTDGEPFWKAHRNLEERGQLAVRASLGLAKRFYVSGLGRIIAAKGFQRLPSILRIVRATHPEVGLIVVGDGPGRTRIESLCRQIGYALGEDIVFAGEIRDSAELAQWLYCSDLSIVPGYAGLAVVDSLFMGVPVVLAPPGPGGPYHSPEWKYLRDTVGGLFAEDDSVEALAGRIVSYLSLPGPIRLKIADQTRQYAAHNLGVGPMVRGINDILDRLPETPANSTRARRAS